MAFMVYFYDIPVYRLKEDEYNNDRDKFIDKSTKMYEHDHNYYVNLRDLYFKDYGGMWLYNEIIGYIRLHFLGTQVRGEYYSVNKKRIVKSRRKQFEYKTYKLVPEREIRDSSSNEKIFSVILEYVDGCRKELKGRYIDSSGLETLGPYVDWKALFERPLENQRP